MTPKEPDFGQELASNDLPRRRRIFRNPHGHLRAGWRISAFLALMVPCLLPTIAALKALAWLFPLSGGEGFTSPANIAFMIGLAFSIGLASYITLRWIDERPYELLGLGFGLSNVREILIGCAIGAGNVVAVVLVLTAFGYLRITSRGIDAAVIQSMCFYALTFAAAAAVEELVNRGYIFQAICEGTRAWIAVLGTSLLFSTVHLFNEHMSAASLLFLFVHGVLYAVVYLKTRSLWTAIGTHWSWNWMQGSVLGINVSGTTVTDSLFSAQPLGPEVFSGGQFGLEGSIFASLVSVGFVVLVWRATWLAPSERMVTLWSQYPTGRARHP